MEMMLGWFIYSYFMIKLGFSCVVRRGNGAIALMPLLWCNSRIVRKKEDFQPNDANKAKKPKPPPQPPTTTTPHQSCKCTHSIIAG